MLDCPTPTMCNPFVDYFWSKSAYVLLEKHDAHDPTSEPNALRALHLQSALHANLPSMKSAPITAPTTENSKDIQPRTPSDASLN